MSQDHAFLVVVDQATPDQLEAAHEAIKKKSGSRVWWHHFANTWLVSGGTRATDWRNAVWDAISKDGPGGAGVLVVRLPANDNERAWAMNAPDVYRKSKWLHKNYSHSVSRHAPSEDSSVPAPDK